MRQLYLATMLEEAVDRRGLTKGLDAARDPVAREAARLGVAELNAALEYALANRLSGACIGAAEVLGQFGKAQDALRTGAGRRRWSKRSATRTAASAWRPWKRSCGCNRPPPLAGSSHVLESLCFLAAGSGVRRALVAGPNAAALQDLSETLSGLGYQTDTATNGRQALSLALASPDYEVAFLDTTIDDPPAGLLVQQFRHDCRTAGLRMGILARWGRLQQAQRIAREDPLSMAFSRPQDPQAVRWQLAQLATLEPRQFVDARQRQAEALRAMRCLAVLAATSTALYDMSAPRARSWRPCTCRR